MQWDVCLHRDALEQIGALPLALQAEVYAGIERLAQDPVKLAKYPVIPFAWKGAVYSFSITDAEKTRHVVTVMFYFDDDPAKTIIYVRDFAMVTPFYGAKPDSSARESKPQVISESDASVIEIPAEPRRAR